MKLVKKILSCVLAVLMLTMIALPAAATEPEKLTRVEAAVSQAVIGARIDSITVTSAEPEKYTAEIRSIYYWVPASGGGTEAYYPAVDELFKAGTQYFCRVRFVANDGYRLDANTTSCVIPGHSNVVVTGSSASGTTVTWEYSFFAQEDQGNAPGAATGCVYCGGEHHGFFGFFIQIIHNVLYSLFGAKKR